jgi:hypothetical protein
MRQKTRQRITLVVLAPVAALAGWRVIEAIGVDLTLKSSSVSGGTVGPGDIVVGAVVGALLGWLVASLIERHSRNPMRRWSFVGSTGLGVSMIGPTWLADGVSAVALISLHAIVGFVVIAGFARTLPYRNPRMRPVSRSQTATTNV